MYEEYEAKYVLDYNPNDIESIIEASKKYANLVISKRGFRDDYCVIQFKPSEAITKDVFAEHTVLSKHVKSKYGTTTENLEDSMLTETLFFANALRFPELEEVVKSVVEDVVTFSRETNDSSEMWINCEEPFALEWLTLFTTVYPQYGYLLGSFFIPYWDDEHMPESLETLSAWSKQFGINSDTIKAYCYCDNSSARKVMLGFDIYGYSFEKVDCHFDLITHFRNDPSAYEFFKKTLAERFKALPFLQHTDDERYYIENPIKEIVIELLMVHHPEEEEGFDEVEYLEHTFVHKSAREEIDEITQYIEEENQQPIVPSHKEYVAYLQSIKEKRAPKTDLEGCWKPFILDSFSNGIQIWNYIKMGEQVFDFSEVEAINLYQKIDTHDSDLILLFEQEYIHSNGDLYEDLDRVLKAHFIHWRKKGNIKNTEKQMALRLLDLIFRWLNRKPFENDTQTILAKHQICSEPEFQSRYKAHWFSELEFVLNEFGGYSSTVTREQLEKGYVLIEENRQEAISLLNQSLFQQKKSRSHKSYGNVEVVVLASYLVHNDRKKKYQDELTINAINFMNKHLYDAVVSDLIRSMTFSDLIIKKGEVQKAPDYYQEEQRLEYEKLAEEYHLFIESLKSENLGIKTSQLLEKHLKIEEDSPISKEQPHIDWMDNFSDKTQKLLVAIHYIFNEEEINQIKVLRFVLKSAFQIAPVKTVHFLDKIYKEHPYRYDTPQQFLSMLDLLLQFGLTEEGYWGYAMEQFYHSSNPEDSIEYKEMLCIWQGTRNMAFSVKCECTPHQYNLTKGIQKLPFRLQNKLLAEAKKVIGDAPLEVNYKKSIVDYFDRKLQKEFIFEDYPIYFKNRLEGEKTFCEYIKWDTWQQHKELLQTIIKDINIEYEDELNPKEAQEELWKIKGWRYIILQKNGENLTPIYGERVLSLLQQGFDQENIYYAHTHCIIIDQNCPADYIEELLSSDMRFNHEEIWRNSIKSFLLYGGDKEKVELISQYGIDKWRFNQEDDYSETSIKDLFDHLPDALQKRVLYLLGCISEEALVLHLKKSPQEYYELLEMSKVDYSTIFRYFLSQTKLSNPNIYLQIFKQTDGVPLIESEKTEIKIPMLSIMSHLPKYYQYIISLENSSSTKIKEHAKMLIEKYQLKEKVIEYVIVDFGIYKMLGNTDEGGERKIANEPVLLEETDQISAKINQYIGLRFTVKNHDKAPKICQHMVHINHPIKDENGQISYTQTSWRQNGLSNSNIFLGWYFESEEEVIEGEYKMSTLDEEGNLLVSKSFSVL
ncbi:DUF3859 domain-containing protein [Flammeovirga sp. OC4]|uniref:DUF3859 domain-containing protein n=1 Tax=Flammeovirga sp. OC4 TaxID=1382345 RepID=UPI0005C4BFED|nr:DUF3859 domain-containing protein [Flammeovirga sp. OC4]